MSDHRKPATSIHPSSLTVNPSDPHESGAATSARRPIVSRMRSRGRSITATDPANTPVPPASSSTYAPVPSTSTSTSLLASPSLASPNLLPAQLPFRNRAPTLTLALPSSQLSTVLEPDTPDKPYGPPSHQLDRLPPAPSAAASSSLVPATNGVRSRSSSVGQAVKGASIVVSGEVGIPGSAGGQHPASRGETSAQGASRQSTSYERPSSSMGLSSSSMSAAPGAAGWLPAERSPAGRAIGGRVGQLFRSNSAASTSSSSANGNGKQRAEPGSPSATAARRWAGERRDSFSDEEEGRRNGSAYYDEEDGASLDGSEEGSESSLNIKLHNSQLHLPLYPLKPPSHPRRPTLTFTAPPPLTPPQSDSPTSFSPTDPSTTYFTPWSASLPTPALSSASLSAYNLLLPEEETVVVTTSTGSRVTGAQLASLARGMIPTLVGIALCFVASLGLVAMLLTSLPIPPSLRSSLPKSTSDIRLLSSSITDYMGASRYGLLHTLIALGVTGVWTHAWSVPGSVVLNILLGALLPSIPAVLFLTLTTTIGGFCSYLLSRPLSPIITLLFPTQLAVVRSSITSSGATWRKLLVMRATGLVPWSGMNVACGVVGVRWEVFCGTFAAGSLSWNYVTSQIGSILMRISTPLPSSLSSPNPHSPLLPSDPTTSATTTLPSESLSSLLRDPVLIGKLIALSLLTLLPVLLKPKTTVVQDGEVHAGVEAGNPWWGVLKGGGSRVVGQGKRWMGGALGRVGRWAEGVVEMGGLRVKSMGGLGRRGIEEDGGVVEMREGLLGGPR